MVRRKLVSSSTVFNFSKALHAFIWLLIILFVGITLFVLQSMMKSDEQDYEQFRNGRGGEEVGVHSVHKRNRNHRISAAAGRHVKQSVKKEFNKDEIVASTAAGSAGHNIPLSSNIRGNIALKDDLKHQQQLNSTGTSLLLVSKTTELFSKKKHLPFLVEQVGIFPNDESINSNNNDNQNKQHHPNDLHSYLDLLEQPNSRDSFSIAAKARTNMINFDNIEHQQQRNATTTTKEEATTTGITMNGDGHSLKDERRHHVNNSTNIDDKLHNNNNGSAALSIIMDERIDSDLDANQRLIQIERLIAADNGKTNGNYTLVRSCLWHLRIQKGEKEKAVAKKGTTSNSISSNHTSTTSETETKTIRTRVVDMCQNSGKEYEQVFPYQQQRTSSLVSFDTNSSQSTKRLLIYNNWEHERFLCGKSIQPDKSRLSRSICKDFCCNQPSRLSLTDPILPPGLEEENSWKSSKNFKEHKMPAIVVTNLDDLPSGGFDDPSISSPDNSKIIRWEKCNVPCYISTNLTDERTIHGTDWKITWGMESFHYYPKLRVKPLGYRKNNFWATSDLASDIPLPYFDFNQFDLLGSKTQKSNFSSVLYGYGIKGASFLAMNCESKNNREHLITKLIEHNFRVDSLSQCLHNADAPFGLNSQLGDKGLIMKQYLFHLSFENGCVKDYITEKLWGALSAGTIPVYYGASNVKEHLPNFTNAIIDTRDFSTVKALADYLNKVANNRTLYEFHQAWRSKTYDTPSLLPPEFHKKYDFTNVHSNCRLCRWAYAKKYGFGWNHANQTIETTVYPRGGNNGNAEKTNDDNVNINDYIGGASENKILIKDVFVEEWLMRNINMTNSINCSSVGLSNEESIVSEEIEYDHNKKTNDNSGNQIVVYTKPLDDQTILIMPGGGGDSKGGAMGKEEQKEKQRPVLSRTMYHHDGVTDLYITYQGYNNEIEVNATPNAVDQNDKYNISSSASTHKRQEEEANIDRIVLQMKTPIQFDSLRHPPLIDRNACDDDADQEAKQQRQYNDCITIRLDDDQGRMTIIIDWKADISVFSSNNSSNSIKHDTPYNATTYTTTVVQVVLGCHFPSFRTKSGVGRIRIIVENHDTLHVNATAKTAPPYYFGNKMMDDFFHPLLRFQVEVFQ